MADIWLKIFSLNHYFGAISGTVPAWFVACILAELRRPENAAAVPVARKRRRSKYDDNTRNVCLSCWLEAGHLPAVRRSINTRTTYRAAFDYFRRILAGVGVRTVAAFKAVIHAIQSRECEERRRRLEEKRNAGTVPASDEAETAQKVAQTPPIRKILDKVVGVILRGLSPHRTEPAPS